MILLRLIRISSAYSFAISFGIVLACLTVGSSVGLMMTGAYLITLAGLQSSISSLELSIVGVRFFGISRGVFRYIERIYTHEAIFKLLKEYRIWFFKNLTKIAPVGLLKYNSADLLQRLVSDVENLDNFYIKIVVPFTTSIIVSTALGLIFCSINRAVGYFTLILLFISVFVLPSLIYFSSKISSKNIIKLNGRASGIIMDLIYGNEDLRMFARYKEKFESASIINRNIYKAQKKLNFKNSIASAIAQLLIGFGVIVIILITKQSISSLHMPRIYLPVLVLGFISGFEPILQLFFSIQKLSSILESSKRIFEVIDFKRKTENPDIELIPSNINSAISFNNVSFAYNKNDKFMLSHISLSLKKNTFSLIVGESGAGKSSLINLLMKFWTQNSGSISINGNGLNDIHEEDIPKIISVCQQKVYLFNTTILENLTEHNKTATESDVIEALKIAEAYSFISTREDGLNTVCGEQGHNFSGGEIRRLSIARTLLSNAEILIFDEPLAGIDYETGKKIINNLLKLKVKRSIIIISHILTDEMTNADAIYIFNNGSIEISGTHTTLVESNNSFYKKLNNMRKLLSSEDVIEYENE